MNDGLDTYRQKLEACLEKAKDGGAPIDGETAGMVRIVVDNSGNATGVLAVTLTSILKKSIDPGQDVRRHQAQMPGGYSGRGLDSKVVTPWLKRHYFPAMRSGSGWLTRSLEQAVPYTLNYPGNVNPPPVKAAFLGILDAVQDGADPDGLMVYFAERLIEKRERERVDLALPAGRRINDIVDMLGRHFTADYGGAHGAARLPVLAVYAAYEQMMAELRRYKGCELRPMQHHTAADAKTGTVGDIEVEDGGGRLFEALEIKHGQAITLAMVENAYEKFRAEGIKRYYVLTTHEDYQGSDDMTDKILEIHRNTGCQVIVNGVMHTLRYYLRLLDDPTDFLRRYVDQLSQDPTVLYEHKSEWNRIAGGASA